MRRAVLLATLALAACGDFEVAVPTPPVTTLTPPPGPFNDKVTVTLSTNVPATVFVTTDGSNPSTESPARKSGPSPFTVELDRTTTLTFFARTSATDELVRSVQYYRAGGPKGTARGVVVVGDFAVGQALAIVSDGETLELPTPTAPGEVPFEVKGLGTGSHRLRAISDRNGDGEFVPFLDYQSDPYDFQIDTEDPFRSNVERVRLLLGASPDGFCTLTGKVKVPKPATGQSVSISAIDAGSFTNFGGDPTGLLAQLQNGYQVFAEEGTDEYPYVITDLTPGQYTGLPLLTAFGTGGIGLNFMANPLQPVNCPAGKTVVKNYEFGPVGLSGTVTYTPPGDAGGFTYGIVAARNASLLDGIQVVLMPVLFVGGAQGATTLSGNYAGQGLRANSQFHVKVFVPQNGSQPIADALAWAINVTEPGQLSPPLRTTAADVILDFTAP